MRGFSAGLTTAVTAVCMFMGAFMGMQAAAEETCSGKACFEAALRDCEPARYRIFNPMGQVLYEVLERTEAGDCRLAMTFKANPNPDWVDQPLIFVLNPAAALEPQLKKAVESCLTGSAGHWQCDGPLLSVVGGD